MTGQRWWRRTHPRRLPDVHKSSASGRGGQAATESAKAFVDDLLRNAAKLAQIAEAGVAAKFCGGKPDGFEDLWFGHGDALSGKQSVGHLFPFGKRKATQAWVAELVAFNSES